ncbi:MAG: NUDIX hydrolase [Chloroflexi bacterium]|nr:NUDIX hydrolase [Chloroflexota bacterium]
MSEETISREVIFEGALISLYRDRVRLPSGRESIREVVHHPGAVCIVPVTPEGKFALICQYRYPAGKRIWELPAGTLEPGEDHEYAARRELSEEIGAYGGKWRKLGGIFSTPGFCDETLAVYLCVNFERGEEHADYDEDIRQCEFSTDEVLAMIKSGEIEDSKTIAGIFLALMEMGAFKT